MPTAPAILRLAREKGAMILGKPVLRLVGATLLGGLLAGVGDMLLAVLTYRVVAEKEPLAYPA